MKKQGLLIKLILIFLLSVGTFIITYNFLSVLITKNNEIKNLDLLTKVFDKYESGKYTIKKGNIYNEDNKIIEKTNYKGNGEAFINDFGINIKIQNKYCIYKTTGNEKLKIYDGRCEKLTLYENLEYSHFGAQITLNIDGYYYVTSKPIVPKEWKKINNKVIYLPYVGSFYIWIKNESGVIYDYININVDCSKGKYNDISKSLIYCTGAQINYMNYSWHVIKDINGELTMLMDTSSLVKMSHCDNNINNKYCYYKTQIVYEPYRWSKSQVNNYLNSEVINTLNKNEILKQEICDDASGMSGCKDNDGCSGYLKEEILKGKYNCKKYTESYIRLLTYSDYEYILKHTNDTSWIYNSKTEEFWLMNGYYKSGYYASKIDGHGNYYLDEYASKPLDVRGVITIKK